MREFLPELTVRKKWHDELRNLKPGDIVAVLDGDNSRGTWRLGRVLEIRRASDNVVRSVVVRVSSKETKPEASKVTDLVRPVHRLCLLQPSENVDVPVIVHRAGCVPHPATGK